MIISKSVTGGPEITGPLEILYIICGRRGIPYWIRVTSISDVDKDMNEACMNSLPIKYSPKYVYTARVDLSFLCKISPSFSRIPVMNKRWNMVGETLTDMIEKISKRSKEKEKIWKIRNHWPIRLLASQLRGRASTIQRKIK